MRINIALGMTTDWFGYAQVTIASILDNASSEDDYYFYILSNQFEESAKESFIRLNKIKPANFEFILIDDSYFDGAIHDWLGVSSSYRLRLPSVVNEPKVLYLDSDIIAMEDIAPLYKNDVSDYYLGAVEDKCAHMMKLRIKLGAEYNFYNGGVQLINLDAFRRDNLEEIIMEKLRLNKIYTDQDVINDVCKGKILQLPLKYNIMPMPSAYKRKKEEFEAVIKNPVLVHFTQKPWRGAQVMHVEQWQKYNNMVKGL